MAKSQVVSNAKAFAAWSDDVAKKEATGVMTAMSYTVDAARMAAADLIIPSSVPGRVILWSKGRAGAYGRSSVTGRLVRANKLQPSTPGRLTERTGLYQKTLRTKGRWIISASRAKFDAPHWGINIRPQLSGGVLSFVGNVRLTDKGPVSDMAGRIYQEKVKGRAVLGPALQATFNERIAPELIANIADKLR
jgi:hypothetical protein